MAGECVLRLGAGRCDDVMAASSPPRPTPTAEGVRLSTIGLFGLIVTVAVSVACSQNHETTRGEPSSATAGAEGEEATDSVRSFAVYALSRGKGVPDEAREVLSRIQALVEADRERGVAVRVERTRLGIEGETRLCATYEDAAAASATFRRAAALSKGVDLINLVAEPCSSSEPAGKQDDKPKGG